MIKWPFAIGLDITAVVDKRQLRLPALIFASLCYKELGLAADKLLIRDNMKSAIRDPNLEIWTIGDATAIGFHKAAIGFDKLFKRALIKQQCPAVDKLLVRRNIGSALRS